MNGLKRKTAYLLVGIILVASLGACSLSKEIENGGSTGDVPQNNPGIQGEYTVTDITAIINENGLLNEEFDSSYREDTIIEITAESDVFTAKGRGVVVNGNVVTITAEGCYRLSGVMENGQVIVDTDNGTDIRLVLDNFEIHNDSGAAIYVANAGNIIMTLEEGTQNILEQTGTMQGAEELQDAALYSTDDLIVNGTGSLIINGSYGHGIKAKDTLLLAESTIEITAKEDAINVNMDMLVDSGIYLLSAGDDGIHTDTNLTIRGGEINVSESYEGLEGMQIWIEDGLVSLVADDDAVNIASNTASDTTSGSATNAQRNMGRGQFGGMEYQDTSGFVLVVNGGTIIIQAGGDGIDSNGSILMTGGTLEISGPTNNGNGSLDYAGSCRILGGTFKMAGASGMAQTPDSSSTQAGVMIYYNTTVSKGTAVVLKDKQGNIVAQMTPVTNYQCAYISTPELVQGETYSLWEDDTQLCELILNNVINYYSSDGTESRGGFDSFGGEMNQGGMHQGGMGFDDGKGKGGRNPEGMKPPEGMELPEGMIPPEGMEIPDETE